MTDYTIKLSLCGELGYMVTITGFNIVNVLFIKTENELNQSYFLMTTTKV